MGKAAKQRTREVYIGEPMFEGLGLQPEIISGAPPVAAASGDQFRDDALAALRTLAQHRTEITVDDLYAVMPSFPAHYNAMGRLWGLAVAQGIVADTGRQVRTKRPEAHGRKVPVYRSLLAGT